jgi:hypothetical protein
MKTFALLALFGAALCAEDFTFKPITAMGKPIDVEHTCVHFTWDKPEFEVASFHMFLFVQRWPDNLEKKIPDFRARLSAETFDAAAWKSAGGPGVERVTIAVDGRDAIGAIDQRAKYPYSYAEVLLVDKEGKWRNAAGFKADVKPASNTRSDLYYLPSYVTALTLERSWDKAPTKWEWTLPELGGGPYEITKVWFLGLDKMYGQAGMEELPGKLNDFLAGKDAKVKPFLMELAKDATGAWHDDGIEFYYPIVLAETKSGLKFACKLKRFGNKNENCAQASAEEQNTLPKLVLRRAGE